MRIKAAYPWPFFAAMAATLLLFFSFQALFSTLPLYVAAIGGSPADNGLAAWAFALAALLTRPLAGSLADRWDRKPLLVVGALVFGSGPLLYRLATDVPSLLGARAIHGVGMALFSTTYQAFIADLLEPGGYGEGLGLANTASVATMVVAPLFGERVVRASGFSALFLALGAVGSLGGAVALVLPGRRRADRARALPSSGGHPGSEDSAPAPPAGRAGLLRAWRQPGVRWGTLGMALLGVPFGAFIVFVPLLADARGLGGSGWIFGAYALASLFTQPVAGRIADRWGTGRTALVGLALVGLAAAGLAVGASEWGLIALAVFFGVGYGAARAGLDACVQESVEPALRGCGAAIQYTAHDLLIGLGSWGLGWLAGRAGYGVMYGVVGGITLLGLVLIGNLRRQ